jgi:hypothetical protein
MVLSIEQNITKKLRLTNVQFKNPLLFAISSLVLRLKNCNLIKYFKKTEQLFIFRTYFLVDMSIKKLMAHLFSLFSHVLVCKYILIFN